MDRGPWDRGEGGEAPSSMSPASSLPEDEVLTARVNQLLQQVGINAPPITSTHELRQSASSVFVAIFEKIFALRLRQVNRSPLEVVDDVKNAEVVVAQLKQANRGEYASLVGGINGEAIGCGDLPAIARLVEIFYDIASRNPPVHFRASSSSGLGDQVSWGGGGDPERTLSSHDEGETSSRGQLGGSADTMPSQVREGDMVIGSHDVRGRPVDSPPVDNEDADTLLGGGSDVPPRPLVKPPSRDKRGAGLPSSTRPQVSSAPSRQKKDPKLGQSQPVRSSPDDMASSSPNTFADHLAMQWHRVLRGAHTDTRGAVLASQAATKRGKRGMELRSRRYMAESKQVQDERARAARLTLQAEARQADLRAKALAHHHQVQRIKVKRLEEKIKAAKVSERLQSEALAETRVRSIGREALRQLHQFKRDVEREEMDKVRQLHRYGLIQAETIESVFRERMRMVREYLTQRRRENRMAYRAQEELMFKIVRELEEQKDARVSQLLDAEEQRKLADLHRTDELYHAMCELLQVEDWQGIMRDRFMATTAAGSSSFVDHVYKDQKRRYDKRRQTLNDSIKDIRLKKAYGSRD